ncbi:MAG: 16S rRNA (cytosine(1402)-N(4))-methyltransferase RsmH [Eubacteriales bacterium]
MDHKPVLLHECIESLKINPEGIYLDGTLGRGGHSAQIASRLTTGTLICLDRDQVAIDEAKKILTGENIKFFHSDFREINKILQNFPQIDGMLFDLGVSSPQLDVAERGFSYRNDAPLDMRMNQEDTLTAHQIVNGWGREELFQIISRYGEEKFAGRISEAICNSRPINTTLELVEVIKKVLPNHALREKQHPAKRTFQAIRIAVNDELGALTTMLEGAITHLKPGGRIAVITFHSLEDRIVKQAFVAQEGGCDCPPELPMCVCNKTATLKRTPRKAIKPTTEEVEENPRARSAKLRVAEKVE